MSTDCCFLPFEGDKTHNNFNNTHLLYLYLTIDGDVQAPSVGLIILNTHVYDNKDTDKLPRSQDQ